VDVKRAHLAGAKGTEARVALPRRKRNNRIARARWKPSMARIATASTAVSSR
jgi:hypothetical protein